MPENVLERTGHRFSMAFTRITSVYLPDDGSMKPILPSTCGQSCAASIWQSAISWATPMKFRNQHEHTSFCFRLRTDAWSWSSSSEAPRLPNRTAPWSFQPLTLGWYLVRLQHAVTPFLLQLVCSTVKELLVQRGTRPLLGAPQFTEDAPPAGPKARLWIQVNTFRAMCCFSGPCCKSYVRIIRD